MSFSALSNEYDKKLGNAEKLEHLWHIHSLMFTHL